MQTIKDCLLFISSYRFYALYSEKCDCSRLSIQYPSMRYYCFRTLFRAIASQVDTILKSALKSVSYGSNVPLNVIIFPSLQLPFFQTHFFETVVLRYYWSDTFNTPRTSCRLLRQVCRFDTPRSRTHYGDCMRRSYVPQEFNSLPDSSFALGLKGAPKFVLRTKRCQPMNLVCILLCAL